jgi:hypothetical protein
MTCDIKHHGACAVMLNVVMLSVTNMTIMLNVIVLIGMAPSSGDVVLDIR